MRDYLELVSELRESAEWADRLAVLMGRDVGDSKSPLMRKAADAVMNLLSFALEMAHLAISLPNDDDCISAEVVLRKLNRIGIVRKERNLWVYDREKVTDE